MSTNFGPSPYEDYWTNQRYDAYEAPTYHPVLEVCYGCDEPFTEGEEIHHWFEHYVHERCVPEAWQGHTSHHTHQLARSDTPD